MLRSILAAIGLMVACSFGESVDIHAEAAAAEVGKPYPDFTLPDLETRRPVNLSQFRGKKVLLIEFASW